MSTTPAAGRALPTAEAGLTTDELFRVIAEQQRRDALRVIYRRDGEVDDETLAVEVAETDEVERDVAAQLHHLVLPTLERKGLVSRSDDGHLSLTDGGQSVVTWLQTVTDR